MSCFAECKGKLYVAVTAVMHPLIPFVDGLPIAMFGKSKKIYLPIDTAIAWCGKEILEVHGGHVLPIMNALVKAKRLFEEEKAENERSKSCT